MNIAILLYDNFTALDAIGPMEVLSSVPGARVRFVADQPGTVTNETGLLTVQVAATLDEVPQPDILVVPGGPGDRAAMGNERILSWIRTAHPTARWTTSVCTGALVLGAAGVLHGAPATTHWAMRAELATFGATYVPERFVQHGTIITAAGVSAGIDMSLWLARELTDEATARMVQLFIEYDPQPPFAMPTPPPTINNLTPHEWRVVEQRMNASNPPAPVVLPASVAHNEQS